LAQEKPQKLGLVRLLKPEQDADTARIARRNRRRHETDGRRAFWDRARLSRNFPFSIFDFWLRPATPIRRTVVTSNPNPFNMRFASAFDF
jgi:hypothetical protein